MIVNPQGKSVAHLVIPFSELTLEERKEVVDLLFQRLDLLIIRTNGTKSGNWELQLHSRK